MVKPVLLWIVRYGIGIALIVVGLVVVMLDASPTGSGWEGWALFTGAGVSVLLLNFLYRMGVEGDKARDREEAARRYFDQHGRWPD